MKQAMEISVAEKYTNLIRTIVLNNEKEALFFLQVPALWVDKRDFRGQPEERQLEDGGFVRPGREWNQI